MNVIPACLVDDESFMQQDYEMSGLGSANLNAFFLGKEDNLNAVLRDQKLILNRMRVRHLDIKNCSAAFEESFDQRKLMCAGNEQLLVPNVCRIEHGGPLEREIWRYDKYYGYVFGVTVRDENNCGFGMPALFVKIAGHIDWINSVVLNKG
jgi:hypothetical protein